MAKCADYRSNKILFLLHIYTPVRIQSIFIFIGIEYNFYVTKTNLISFSFALSRCVCESAIRREQNESRATFHKRFTMHSFVHFICKWCLLQCFSASSQAEATQLSWIRWEFTGIISNNVPMRHYANAKNIRKWSFASKAFLRHSEQSAIVFGAIYLDHGKCVTISDPNQKLWSTIGFNLRSQKQYHGRGQRCIPRWINIWF